VELGARIPPRCVRDGGMSLHADVVVPGNDRRRLERLCRYVARPPLALDRLEAMADGRLAYRLKTRWRDGTTHVLMERHELLERLAPLIPPPRAHQVRYHGVLAPCASGRSRVVPSTEGQQKSFAIGNDRRSLSLTTEVETPIRTGPRDRGVASAESADDTVRLVPDRIFIDWIDVTQAASARKEEPVLQRRVPWAELLRRVFEVDALCCPKCGGRMRILSAITDPTVAARILQWLVLPSRAPPLATSRGGAGRSGFSWDQFPDATPDFDFDQSQSSDDYERSD